MKDAEIHQKLFDNCRFEKCNFNKTKFISCKFVDCEFKACDLSLIDINNTTFNEVVFDTSKLIGINWTHAKWPQVRLGSSIQFYSCNISHSSFFQLQLSGFIAEECKAHDVDFREGDFSEASFMLTDFDKSYFMRTKLHSADFTQATNYTIDPNENDIFKAKFSMPEVVSLLNAFDIDMQW